MSLKNLREINVNDNYFDVIENKNLTVYGVVRTVVRKDKPCCIWYKLKKKWTFLCNYVGNLDNVSTKN